MGSEEVGSSRSLSSSSGRAMVMASSSAEIGVYDVTSVGGNGVSSATEVATAVVWSAEGVDSSIRS